LPDNWRRAVSDDKDAIRDLLHCYCFYMDEGRFAELAALFTADGEWIAPYRTATGPAEIAAWLQQSVPPQPRRMHYVMNSPSIAKACARPLDRTTW
jgi:hypothetical protein